MFDRDPFGLSPALPAAPLRGGVAPSRHWLTKQRYLAAQAARCR